jgi:hypothetical protein
VQRFDTLDDNAVTAGAGDPRSHRDEAVGEVADFRLACRVFQNRRPRRQGRCHHQILGAGHRDDVEHKAHTGQTRRLGVDVAMVEIDFGAHRLQTLDVLIDRAEPDGTSSGQRYTRLSAPREQRPERQDRRPHGLHHLVRSQRPVHLPRRQCQRPVVRFHPHAHLREQRAHGANVVQLRQIVERERFWREQCGAQNRQRRVFRAGNGNLTLERDAALDREFFH